MFRMQVIGPVLAVIAVPAMVVGIYVYTLRADLAAANRVITMERAARGEWQQKYAALKQTADEAAATLATCINAKGDTGSTSRPPGH